MDRFPTEEVCCGICFYRVHISENYCWVCCRLNPPLAVRLNPPDPPRALLQ